MKNIKIYIIIILSTLLISCGGGGGSSNGEDNKVQLSGVSQKGPFVQGAIITAYKLNANGTKDNSNQINTTTTDNLGTFNFSNISWTGATEFVASGNYFDENDNTTNNTAELSAIVDITEGSNITTNINIFTHLEAQRIKALMASSTDITTAQTQAQNLIKNTFGLTSNTPLTELNLATGNNIADNLELLKTSAAIAKNTALLNSLATAMQDGEVANDTSTLEQLRQNFPDINEFNTIRNNLQNLDSSISPPTDTHNINRAPILAPIANQIKTYGDRNFQIILNTVDLDNDTLNLTSQQTNNNIANLSINNNILTIAPQNAGTTQITITANDGTVNATQSFTLTINTKQLTITADNKTKTYDNNSNTDPALSYSITSGNLIGDDILSGTLTRVAGQDAGTYDINQGTINNANNQNYDITFSGATLTINKRPVTITADNKTKVFNQNDPTLTFTTNPNLISGDNVTGSLSRASGENVGFYTILQNTLSVGNNYNLTFNAATLTITKASQPPISIDNITKDIDDESFIPTYTSGNGTGGLILTNSSNQSVATIVNNQINLIGIGTTTISVYKEGDTNFEDSNHIDFILTVTGTNDNTPPIITLLGDNPQFIKLGDDYTELGATANDNTDGSITANIQVNSSNVNTSVLGSYNVIYSVSDSSNNATQQTRTVNIVNTIPLLVVRIEFNDFSFVNSTDVWENKIFGTSEGQLNHYFNEVSGSKFQFTKANETQETINDGVITILVNTNHIGNPSSLATTFSELINNSVIPQIDNDIDFSQYDVNNDGGISNDELQFVFVLAGGEAATGWSQSNGIWARAGCFNGSWHRVPIADNIRLIACADNGWHATVGERHGSSESDPNVRDATIGVIAHELGHSAFNLPDSYGVSGIEGISRFSLMATGTWARKPGDLYLGETPTHLSGWDKTEIGWMEPTIIATNGNYIANDISNNSNIFRINTAVSDEYFLIENRNNAGYDRGLDMLSGANGNFLGGLLITHIDENGADSYGHRIINIERANNSSLGHINNLFFAGNSTTFDDNSTPNSRTKNGTSTGIRIINIGNQGESINFNVEGL